MSPVGVAVLTGTLLLALAVGVLLRARAGRVRGARAGLPGVDGWRLAEVPAQGVLLLQLSSPVCAPCRQAAAVLGELSGGTAGLHHVEIDVAERPDIARELGVLRTPTVVAFDRAGTELLRVSGVPRAGELLDALQPALNA